jgi:hypothetical protein
MKHKETKGEHSEDGGRRPLDGHGASIRVALCGIFYDRAHYGAQFSYRSTKVRALAIAKNIDLLRDELREFGQVFDGVKRI